MLHGKDFEYLYHRELAERAAAKNATSDAARRIHQELAQSYADRARGELRSEMAR